MFGYSKDFGLLALVLYLTTGIAALNTTNTSNQSLVDVEPEEVQRAGLFKIQEVLNNDKIYNTINRPYDKNLPWTIRNEPTVISPRIDILRVGDITMDNVFSVDLYFVQRWLEPRLQSLLPGNLTSIRIRGRLLLQKLWLPDTIIRNSQESQHPDDFPQDKDDVVILYRNGTIDFVSRIRAICFCEIDLRDYPFDNQGCKVEFESCTFLPKNIGLFTSKPCFFVVNYQENELVYKPEDPAFARMAPNSIHPSKFELKADRLSHCDQTTLKYYGGESFSSFCIWICFKRNPASVIIRSHVPACLIVLTSFLGFFICPSQVPGRVTLAITCFLAMVTLGLTLRTLEGQDDSVITAVDIYQIACIASVFLTLVEFAVVHGIHNNCKHLYIPECCKTLLKKCYEILWEKCCKNLWETCCKPHCKRKESNKGGTSDGKPLMPNDRKEVRQTTDKQQDQTAPQPPRADSDGSRNENRETSSSVDPGKQERASGKCSKIDSFSLIALFLLFFLFNVGYGIAWHYVSSDSKC